AGSESSALLEAARQRALDERETASQALPAPQMEPMPQPSNEPDRSTTETGSPAPPNPSPSVPALDTETPPTAIDGVGGLDEPIPADAADPADAAATRAWAALDQQDPAAIRAWIAEHPGTRDRPIALKQLEALDDQAWLAALASDTEPAYRLYLEDYGTARTPPGKRANSAETRIIQIQNETALINAEARRLMTALGAFEPDTSITPGQFQDAVTTFQDLVGLEVTGRVTPELINALEESLAARAIALTPPATPTPAQAPPPETNDAPIIDDPIFGAIGDGTETDGPIAASTIPAPRTSELATVTSTEPDSTPPPDPATPPARAVGETFSDCDECPQMRVLKAGSFTMGSPKRERGRADNEGPAKSVTLSAPFAVSTQEVSRSEFAAYLDDTGQTLPAGCYIEDQSGNGSWIFDAAASFANPGFPQSGDHPAVCVSWQDAKSYTQWLTEKTGRPHRLLTEAEWEYAARGGTKRARFWPGGEDGVCGWANGADRTAKAAREKWVTVACDDGHLFTAPGGAFGANGFGLQDMVGSVWEWVEDCFAPNLSATPSDGTPNTTAGCASRVIRGGSWASSPDQLRAAKRSGDGPVVRYNMLGFRVAADPL
ncbi:MAG: formylglycine-generating enzyme family protein, partial [Pseudomonadota bacterium]